MRANLKLHLWIPFLFILVVAFFLMQQFDVLDVVMIVGGAIIIGYFIMALMRRKDALVIDNEVLIVTTPLKRSVYKLSEITEVFYSPTDKGLLQATFDGETINLITNIYDVELETIKQYLVSHYDHISTK